MQVAGKYKGLNRDDGSLKDDALRRPEFSDLLAEPDSIEEHRIPREIPKVRFPIRMKVTLPYLLLALVISG